MEEQLEINYAAIGHIVADMMYHHYVHWKEYVASLPPNAIYTYDQATHMLPYVFPAYMIQETPNSSIQIKSIPMTSLQI